MNNNNAGSSGGSGAPPIMPKLKAVPIPDKKKKVFEVNYSKVTVPGKVQNSQTLVVMASSDDKKALNLTGEVARNDQHLQSIGGGPAGGTKQRSGAPYPQLLTSIHSSNRHESGAGNNEFNLFSHQKLT